MCCFDAEVDVTGVGLQIAFPSRGLADVFGMPAVMEGRSIVLRGAKGHSKTARHQQVTGNKEPPPKAAGCVQAQFRDSPFHQHGDSWLKERSQSKGSSADKHGQAAACKRNVVS